MSKKKKNRTEYLEWEDLKMIISGFKQILESNVGNEIEENDDQSNAIVGISDPITDSDNIKQIL